MALAHMVMITLGMGSVGPMAFLLTSRNQNPDLLEPSTRPLAIPDFDLDSLDLQEPGNGSDGFRLHKAGVQEGRREHVAGDAGETFEKQGATVHERLDGST
jgi:hypothetical protein